MASVVAQEVGHHDEVAVDEHDDVTTGHLDPEVASQGGPPVLLTDEPDVGQLRSPVLKPVDGSIGGTVIDNDHFEVITGGQAPLRLQGPQTLLKDGQAVVSGDDDAQEHRQGNQWE
jgi:hypothetical protein